MQDYIDLAKKNGVMLLDDGPCQFCGAHTQRGVHECLEIFNVGFQDIDFSNPENHKYRFFIVDAHTLQHPEIHGRWNNHFHLSRLHLIFNYQINWTYAHSPRLSDHLNRYKKDKSDEYLTPPPLLHRGHITTTDILAVSDNTTKRKALVTQWAQEVYDIWGAHHSTVDVVAQGFLKSLY